MQITFEELHANLLAFIEENKTKHNTYFERIICTNDGKQFFFVNDIYAAENLKFQHVAHISKSDKITYYK